MLEAKAHVYYCFTTALLLLYYCFTTVLLLFYYCCTSASLLLYYSSGGRRVEQSVVSVPTHAPGQGAARFCSSFFIFLVFPPWFAGADYARDPHARDPHTRDPNARDPHAVQQERVNSNAVNQEEEKARGRPTSNTSFRVSNLKHVVFQIFAPHKKTGKSEGA
jgi:hypothetical protein